MQKLYGTVVPIVTPLTEEDTIDVETVSERAWNQIQLSRFHEITTVYDGKRSDIQCSGRTGPSV